MTTNSKIKINLDSLKARREWKRHKVQPGHNVYRILPPFGDNSNGYVFRKWQVIWGLKDPESGRTRPFPSSMTSEKACPITEYVQNLKKKAETMKSQMQAAGMGEEAIKERLKDLNQLIQDISPKTVYIYNAVNKAGEVGLLELKSTAHKDMKTAMAEYIHDYNQDPTSLNSEDSDSGVWFDITREGEGRDTEYKVKKVQVKVKDASGRMSFQDDRSQLPDSIVENYQTMGYDLSSVYQTKTYDELAEILEANMADLIAICPDADLNNTSVSATLKPAPAKAAPAKPMGKAPVNLRLDEEDDEVVAPKGRTTAAVDDDFLAEADALLNS